MSAIVSFEFWMSCKSGFKSSVALAFHDDGHDHTLCDFRERDEINLR